MRKGSRPMNRRHLYVLIGLLSLVGLTVFFYKVFSLGFPLVPDVSIDLWSVEARVTFRAKDAPVKVTLNIPHNLSRFILIDESFMSHGYGLNTEITNEGRVAIWSIRKAKGEQGLYYRAMIRRFQATELLLKAVPKIVPQELAEPRLTAVRGLLKDIHARSADTESLVRELLKALTRPESNENVLVILGKNPTLIQKAEWAVRILNHGGVPSRVVQGIQLGEESRKSQILAWIEVYNNRKWQPFNVTTGEGKIPDDYLAWRRGAGALATAKGADRLNVGLSVNRVQQPAVSAAMTAGRLRKPITTVFSLSGLPLETQGVYRILFMIPVGAFLLVIFRNVIGVKTFGTFMPVLIALAFRETQLIWGIVLFSLIVSFGLIARLYLEHLKLLLVPRLAAVLIVVVLLMALFSILSHKLGLERGLSVALFPMVIMTMTIERMSIIWDERGPVEALQQGMGSLGVAALAYLVMTFRYTEHLFFVFPELLLVLLAATLLLGRYTGFRLLELFRFKVLTEKEG
jgi:hypothetical protein